jgi:ribosomal protein L11 methyltransferase
VLAIAAAKLGWSPIRAYDHEPAAIEAARANAAANNVDLSPERANLREHLPELAPTTVANMTAPILLAVAELLRKGGGTRRSLPKSATEGSPSLPQTFVCSGLLLAEQDEVSATFGDRGYTEKDRRQDGDWAALLLRRS